MAGVGWSLQLRPCRAPRDADEAEALLGALELNYFFTLYQIIFNLLDLASALYSCVKSAEVILTFRLRFRFLFWHNVI